MNNFALACAGLLLLAKVGNAAAPAWAYPINPTGGAALADDTATVRLNGSSVSFTEAQLHDLFSAPDWHPLSHATAPVIVMHGRAPDVYACGYCHMPRGEGRPENASLAGLPAAYIAQQVADFKSGARRSAGPATFVPIQLMNHVAANATAEEVSTAAQYFASLPMRKRVEVIESTRVPATHVAGWIYVGDPQGQKEKLGERIVELTPDLSRHEHRDDELQYVAYVPVGSKRRGQRLVRDGILGGAPPCESCHGVNLRGVGAIPGLAGRSPTYLVREMLAFQTGERAGTAGAPMRAVAEALSTGAMIDAAAYAAALAP